MSGKRKKQQIVSKRASRRDEAASALPAGAVLADLSRQVPNNSYCAPPRYYTDKPFVCVDCGAAEVWTANQQKRYYEVAKGSLYATAIRCRPCRQRHQDNRSGHGDPNEIKHEVTLIKRVQSEVDPPLNKAGFAFVRRSRLPVKGSVTLDYSRSDLDLSCWYDRPHATLVAETIDQDANCQMIARVPMSAPTTTAAIRERIQEFCDVVKQHVAQLPPFAEDKRKN